MRTVCCRGLGLVLVALAGLTLAGPVRADQKEAILLIDRAIRAHGGEAALRKTLVCIRTEEGVKQQAGGGEVRFTNEFIRQLPDRVRLQFETSDKKLQMIAVLNGDKGWIRSGGTTKEMGMTLRMEMHEEAVVAWQATLLPLLRGLFMLDTVPGINIDGEETAGIKVSAAGYVETKMYFYKRSGLLAAVERKALEGGDPGDKRYVYSGYKTFDGVKLPGKETHVFNGKKVTELTIKSYKFLDRPDESAFERP